MFLIRRVTFKNQQRCMTSEGIQIALL